MSAPVLLDVGQRCASARACLRATWPELVPAVADLAIRLREANGLPSTAAPSFLAQALGLQTVREPDLARTKHANGYVLARPTKDTPAEHIRTATAEERRVIHVDDSLDRLSFQYVVGHEVGHVCLRLTPWFDSDRFTSEVDEAAADVFAEALLVGTYYEGLLQEVAWS